MLHRLRRVCRRPWIVAPALFVVACREPPPASSVTVTDVVLPSPPAPPTPTSSDPVAAPERTRPKKPPPPPIARRTAIGDVTCKTSADCAITIRAECCDCCPSEPLVASRAWLAWRDRSACPREHCAACSAPVCPAIDDPSAFLAVCEGERCTLVRADAAGVVAPARSPPTAAP